MVFYLQKLFFPFNCKLLELLTVEFLNLFGLTEVFFYEILFYGELGSLPNFLDVVELLFGDVVVP